MGCDGSIPLNHDGSERRAEASKSLRRFEVIDAIKAEIEEECPGTVSCADIGAAASGDATGLLGGPYNYWCLTKKSRTKCGYGFIVIVC
ncbi:hypothetical protein NC653_000877 [Populus alba x Populus x berolinensis]|uniref:peroxidase n=1 Tax=Populus alba x Populus x berolinensis TaxID=444605 RepID=A0AAD6WEY0_9ROSI|nr:hypothetical protein NC653_000877 [Populus alba x Populus x berolinensis]